MARRKRAGYARFDIAVEFKGHCRTRWTSHMHRDYTPREIAEILEEKAADIRKVVAAIEAERTGRQAQEGS